MLATKSNRKQTDQLTVVAEFRALAGKEDVLKEVLLSLVDPTHEEEGCLNYDLHQSNEDPTRFLFYENWASRESLDQHLQTNHLKSLETKNRGAFGGTCQIRFLEPSSLKQMKNSLVIYSFILFLFTFGLGDVAKAETVTLFDVASGMDKQVEKIKKTNAEWKKEMDPFVYHITREKGTERAYTGKYDQNKAKGIYRCIACGTDLFHSNNKYDSKTGWPSFWDTVSPNNVSNEKDFSLFMIRTEVHCSRCNSHLGHVFDDGPPPTGKRYCINSASLDFHETS